MRSVVLLSVTPLTMVVMAIALALTGRGTGSALFALGMAVLTAVVGVIAYGMFRRAGHA